MNQKVAVLYYLSRNGRLEHPHFIEVPLSSPDGLYLKDVMNRMNYLRGEGMANLYSWSSKRSYRNGFVWQDLDENDFIHPSPGHEYILKGSELLLHTALTFKSSPENHHVQTNSDKDSGNTIIANSKILSRRSFDSREYKVYKTTYATNNIAGNLAADASTQTGDEKRKMAVTAATELSREGISPPSTSSSNETLETATISTDVDEGDRTVCVDYHGSGRLKVSATLKQLITCGSTSVRFNRDGACEMKEQKRRLSCDV